MVALFYSLLALVPGAIYPALVWAYFTRPLKQKRIELVNTLRGTSFDRYVSAYSPGAENRDAAIHQLFDLTYNRESYLFSAGLTFAVSVAITISAMAWADLPVYLPQALITVIQKAPPEVFAALSGAYFWSLWNTLRRYQVLDLTPVSVHFVWLRLIVTPVMGGLAGIALTEPLGLFAAFGLAVFPLKQLIDFAKSKTRQHLKIGAGALPAERPTLQELQGCTKGLIVRLEEEGISSIQHLANANPVRLLVRTNLEWKLILDLLDQAHLYNYVGDAAQKLRPIGIRGAIELLDLDERLRSPEQQEEANKIVELIASKLGQERVGVLNLIRTLAEDPQVDFIWNLWGEVFSGDD